MFNLTITGNVEKFVTLDPGKVLLLGHVGNHITGSIKIIPEKNHPFKILETTVENGENIDYRLETYIGQNQNGWLLLVDNTRKRAGRYVDAVYLRTSSKIGPKIKILVWGNIKKGVGSQKSEVRGQ